MVSEILIFVLGKLLSLNFQAAHKKNAARTWKDAHVFGLYWLGNGATIKQTLLLNMSVMCGNFTPSVMSIFDCTEHMSADRKKDATFIMELF